jgi:cbb3-type cytochrome oxidase maturation protein
MTPNNAYIFDEATGKVSKHLDTWERRAKEIVVYLDLEKLGVYQLSVIPIDSAVASVLDIKVQENYSRLNYLIMFGVALLLSFLLYYFFVWRYKSKQYSEKEIEDKESIFDSIDDWGQVIIWIVVVLAIIFFGED